MQKDGADCARTDSERYFFLHIPKTAGTSLREYIYGHFDPDETFPFKMMGDFPRAVPPVRRDYRYYEGHFAYDLMRLVIGADPVTMTMLRDPVEQALSLYSFLPVSPRREPILLLGGEVVEEAIEHLRTISIDAYFARPTDDIPTLFQNLQTRLLASKDMLVQDSWVADVFGITLPTCRPVEMGPDLARAKRRLGCFAFVGLTERFRDSTALLSYTFGWRPVPEVRVRNVTERRIRRDDLADHTLARIRELNEMDLALYAHARELFDERYRAMIDDLARRFGRRLPLGEGELDNLLELHYTERFAAAHPPEPSFHIDFTRPVSGAGWHDVEHMLDNSRARWTGPGTMASIDVPIAPGRDLRVTFRVLAALAPDILESVSLRVNDTPVPLDCVRDAVGGTIFSARVPSEALEGGKPYARVAIGAVRTVRPMELDPASDDDRALGVLINWIDFGPTDPYADFFLRDDLDGTYLYRVLRGADSAPIGCEHCGGPESHEEWMAAGAPTAPPSDVPPDCLTWWVTVARKEPRPASDGAYQ